MKVWQYIIKHWEMFEAYLTALVDHHQKTGTMPPLNVIPGSTPGNPNNVSGDNTQKPTPQPIPVADTQIDTGHADGPVTVRAADVAAINAKPPRPLADIEADIVKARKVIADFGPATAGNGVQYWNNHYLLAHLLIERMRAKQAAGTWDPKSNKNDAYLVAPKVNDENVDNRLE